MKKNWNGLVKVLEVTHLSKDNQILWQRKNVLNVIHQLGEKFILDRLFGSAVVPNSYYFGLDYRETPTFLDTMASLTQEPTSNGYIRQEAATDTDFVIELSSGHYLAKSPIVAFNALGGQWGPVRNLFMTDKVDGTGTLISTVQFSAEGITVQDHEKILFQMGITLADCVVS